MKKADDNRPDPPRWERIHLQREGAPEKEEGTTPRREKGASIWAEMAERRRKAGQPEKQEPEKKKKKGRRRRNAPREDDVVLDEAWRVLSDLVRLNGGAEVQQQRGWWF